jgi:predicted AlkP superfamily pyrophosphatase or phosphodiesterase
MTANASHSEPDTADRAIVLDVVGLRPDHVDPDTTPALHDLLEDRIVDLEPPFPAMTVPAQTTMATGTGPETHGDVANGEYDREDDAVEFWDRDRGDRNRLWEAGKYAGLETGALFFQHLIGTSADIAITPSPIEDEDNNLLEMNCWTNPDEFYDLLEDEYGHFPLQAYWGPGASAESSEWILTAAIEAIKRYDLDLLWVYVPHLDYAGQRVGPSDEAFVEELSAVDELLGEFLDDLAEGPRWEETAVTVVSEYGFHDVDTPVFPNRALRETGLLEAADDGDVDFDASEAFAMVDHQIAHVYADAPGEAREALADLDGVDAVLGEDGKRERGVDHPNAGDLVLVAEQSAWFQYYWWEDDDEEPPYATEMDIHAKPGFDPCELFVGDRGLASTDPSKVSGSHGRVDEAAYGAFGWGGPAAPTADLPADDAVDARRVAPTVADVLGVRSEVDMQFEGPSLLYDG